MPIDFRLQDFFHPGRLLRLHRSLERTQWLDAAALQEHQDALVRRTVRRAAAQVPHWAELFHRLGLSPGAVEGAADLRRLPVLGKDVLRERPEALLARDAARHRPRWHSTSGTTGAPVRFVLDRDANVLEFCFYWRHWSWAGYRLGDRFAELGTVHFLARRSEELASWQPHLRRLMLNAARVSPGAARRVAGEMRRRRVRFAKGLASALAHLARCLLDAGVEGPGLRAVFSSGEVLTPAARSAIERAFHCKVLDAYGHMERTVAVAQCEAGGYHVQSDYGVLELSDPRPCDGRGRVATVRGTSLFNRAMPLLRYEVGDDVALLPEPRTCPCGRGLPLVAGILGRRQDTIETPDGRVLSSLFVLFDLVPGVREAQVVQEAPERLALLVVPGPGWTAEGAGELAAHARRMAGPGMEVRLRVVDSRDLERDPSGKLRPVLGLSAECLAP